MSDEIENVFQFSETLENAEAPNPLPKKVYPFEVRAASLDDSKKTPGNKNLKLSLYIAPEEYPADYLDGNPDGTTLLFWKPVKDTVAGRYSQKKFNTTLGVTTKTKTLDPNDFIGVTGMVEVDHQPDLDGVMQAFAAKISAKQ